MEYTKFKYLVAYVASEGSVGNVIMVTDYAVPVETHPIPTATLIETWQKKIRERCGVAKVAVTNVIPLAAENGLAGER